MSSASTADEHPAVGAAGGGGHGLLEREVELDLLADLVRDVGAGRGGVLLFEAAAGLGKSALLEHGVVRGA